MCHYTSQLPVLLELDLFNAGWDGSVELYPGITPRQAAMASLAKSFLKKFQDDISEDADRAALSKFLQSNERCRTHVMDPSRITEIEAIALGEAKDFIYRFFYYSDQTQGDLTPLTLGRISQGFGFGNGANIGSYSTDFLSKVGTSTMAATDPSLHLLFRQAISSDPIWTSVEFARAEVRATEIVRGSRLSFVPKTRDISRTICTEPVCNMMWQKGIAKVLESRLRETCGIDLAKQPDKNRKLARLGSLDGKFGTIDLSSASDSLSLQVVREFFPRHVTEWLERTRCNITILPDGSEVELHMVSSMGNAYTFPLQTLFFTSLVYGVYRALGLNFDRPFRDNLGSFAVFGDDIIVYKEAYGLVVKLLTFVGFEVNVDKSFNDGLFRESCGHDYYHGHNIRGVYVKTLKDVCDRYSAINRLNVWSASHGIYLPSVMSCLLKGLRILPIPFDEMDTAGVKMPSSLLKRPRYDRNTGALQYRCLQIMPKMIDVSDCESRPPRLRGWFQNHHAVYLAALAGTLRLGKVSVRIDRRTTKIRRRVTPCWDHIDAKHAERRDFGCRWKLAVEHNLNLN